MRADLQEIYDNASYLPEAYRNALEEYYSGSVGTNAWKLQNFAKYVPRQSLTRFLVKYEIFKKVLSIQGSIIEMGVLDGGSLMIWAQLSAILEHLNYQRKIIGFDLFGDHPIPHASDLGGEGFNMYNEGKMGLSSFEDITRSAQIYDMNRFLGNIPKVMLVKGDIKQSAKQFLETHPETIVSLLYLDANLYEPTKAALDFFYPRMPKGSVIVFDELNDRGLPGETLALLESIDIKKLKIERFSFDTKISYSVIE